MRYNQLIKEANYKSKFDTSTSYNSEAQFKSTVGSKFGALKGSPARESKPQAGGAVYIMDPDKGIVGYKVPKDESPSGFIWYAVKEPFMPATKGTKKQATSTPVKTAPVKTAPPSNKKPVATATKGIIEPLHYDWENMFSTGAVKVSGDLLGGHTDEYEDMFSYLKGKKGMPSDIWIRTEDNYKTAIIWSGAATSDQLASAMKNKSSVPEKGSSSQVSKEVLGDALYELLQKVKSSEKSSYGGFETHQVEDEGNRFVCGIRDWGIWEMPDDEEDDGDYDWEVLSSKSLFKLREIVDSFAARHPKIKFSFTTEEKNWIMLFARAR